MLLVCIEWFCIFGFKLFVDMIELRVEFGLIGIVGFNGCGKLNVLELLCWVMGVMFVKVLCGIGMDDVIFLGMLVWLVWNMVEVYLILDNSSWKVLVVFNDSEVFEVMCCIECEVGFVYRINGWDVRVWDV